MPPPQFLSDLTGKDLAGHEIIYVYYLNNHRGLMQCGPVVVAETRDVIVVEDLGLLAEIERIMHTQSGQCGQKTKFRAVVNRREGYAFDLENFIQDNHVKPCVFLTKETFAQLRAKVKGAILCWG